MRRARQFGLGVAAFWMMAAAGWAHVRPSEGFQITLPVPFSRLRDVMHEICTDGVVHGTFEYERDNNIIGATAAHESTAFAPWQGRGEACFKIREHTVAPANFEATNDSGVITVRYLVEPVSAQQSHLSIDAIFVEDGRHRRHLSKGFVETSEFREIAKELKAIEDSEKATAAAGRAREEQKQKAQQEAQERAKQQALIGESARLKTAADKVAELENQLQALRRQTLARIRAEGAVLYAAPFSRAQVIEVIEGGQVIKILLRTRYWDRVRTSAAEGWLYHSLIGPFNPLIGEETVQKATDTSDIRTQWEVLERRRDELETELRGLQVELSPPVTFAAVLKPAAPVRGRPLPSARVLFRTALHDEFEIVDDRGAWIQVRTGADEAGWMRRADLDLSAGLAMGDQGAPQITREQLQEFSGDWSELRGRQAEFVWVRGDGDRWATAKQIFSDRYLRLLHEPRGSRLAPAGVVLVFNSAEPAIAAAGMAQIRSWVDGEISEAAFAKHCSLDPSSAFHH